MEFKDEIKPAPDTPRKAAAGQQVVKQRVGPLNYQLYKMFWNHLLDDKKEVPSEEALRAAGMPAPAVQPYQIELNLGVSSVPSQANYYWHNTHLGNQGKDYQEGAVVVVMKKDDEIGANKHTTNQQITTTDEVVDESKTPKDSMYDDDFQILAYASTTPADGCFDDTVSNEQRTNVTAVASEELVKSSQAPMILLTSVENAKLPEVPTIASDQMRKHRFLAWAKKMYVKVTLAANGKDFQVVSLMSKKTNKIIAPLESFEHIILKMHSCNGKSGRLHLPIQNTIMEIKRHYTFGRRDFGMSDDTVRRSVNKCDAMHCISKHGMSIAAHIDSVPKGAVNSETVPTAPVQLANIPAYMKDQFYNDIAQVIVMEDQELMRQKDEHEERGTRRKVAAIKRAGNPQYYARTLKMRRLEEEKNGSTSNCCNSASGNIPASPSVAISSPPLTNPVESMSMETAYRCLVSASQQMRRELLVMYAGERRHFENLSKSLMAAQLLVKRCSALNHRTPQK